MSVQLVGTFKRKTKKKETWMGTDEEIDNRRRYNKWMKNEWMEDVLKDVFRRAGWNLFEGLTRAGALENARSSSTHTHSNPSQSQCFNAIEVANLSLGCVSELLSPGKYLGSLDQGKSVHALKRRVRRNLRFRLDQRVWTAGGGAREPASQTTRSKLQRRSEVAHLGAGNLLLPSKHLRNLFRRIKRRQKRPRWAGGCPELYLMRVHWLLWWVSACGDDRKIEFGVLSLQPR